MSYNSFAMENCYGKFIDLAVYFVLYLNIVVTKFWIPNVRVSMIATNVRVQSIVSTFTKVTEIGWSILFSKSNSKNEFWLVAFCMKSVFLVKLFIAASWYCWESQNLFPNLFSSHWILRKTIQMFTNSRAKGNIRIFLGTVNSFYVMLAISKHCFAK